MTYINHVLGERVGVLSSQVDTLLCGQVLNLLLTVQVVFDLEQ